MAQSYDTISYDNGIIVGSLFFSFNPAEAERFVELENPRCYYLMYNYTYQYLLFLLS